ncbi:Ataxin-1-like [Halotydeus destructor]|nr:Ataxin-1-like [Halotydeus destructor]
MNDVHQEANRSRSIYSSLINPVPISPSASMSSSNNIFQYSPTATSSLLNGATLGPGITPPSGPITPSGPLGQHPSMVPHPYLTAFYQQSHSTAFNGTPTSPFILPSSPATSAGRSPYPYGFDLMYAHQHAQAIFAANAANLHHQQQQHHNHLHHQVSISSDHPMASSLSASRSASSRVSSPPSSHGSSGSPIDATVSPVSGPVTSPTFVTPSSRSPTSSNNGHSPDRKYALNKEARKSTDSLDERQSIAHSQETVSESSETPLHLGFKRKSFTETSDHSGRKNSLKHRILRPPNIHISDQGSVINSESGQGRDLPPLSAPPQIQSRDAITRQWLDLPPPVEMAPLSAPPINEQANGRRFSYPIQGGSTDSGISNQAPNQSPNSLSNCYQRGSLIQLEDGTYKKIEEIQTQDFVNGANTCSDLEVDASVIVKLVANLSTCSVYVTFAVGKKKSTVTVEAPVEHPFFVYHRGWSSFDPERSRSLYGLDCHPLKEGDTCISLTKAPRAPGNKSQNVRNAKFS